MNAELQGYYVEYVAMLAAYNAADVAEANDDDVDAADWAAAGRAMQRAESDHFERFEPHRVDMEREDAMGYT